MCELRGLIDLRELFAGLIESSDRGRLRGPLRGSGESLLLSAPSLGCMHVQLVEFYARECKFDVNFGVPGVGTRACVLLCLPRRFFVSTNAAADGSVVLLVA